MSAMLVPAALLLPGARIGETAISHKAAHKCLKECRAWMSDNEGGVRYWEWDLTDGQFDWRRYLRHHPASVELICSGVTKFEVRFLSSWDHNMQQPRCDFIVHRTDGTAARVHPSSTAPGQIVTGMLDEWLPHGHTRPLLLDQNAGAAEHNTAGAAEHNARGSFRTLHQVDTISRKAAGEFLQRNLQVWRAREHPRGAFMVNLMETPNGHVASFGYFFGHTT